MVGLGREISKYFSFLISQYINVNYYMLAFLYKKLFLGGENLE